MKLRHPSTPPDHKGFLSESISRQPSGRPLGAPPDGFLTEADPGFFADLWDFVKTSRKWWLLLVLLIFLAAGVLLALSQTAAAPFIYTLF